MSKKKKDDFIDDGRTIANMDYDMHGFSLLPRRSFLNGEKKIPKAEEKLETPMSEQIPFSKQERKIFIKAGFMAALTVGLIAVGLLFLLFWFLKTFWLKV